MTLPASFRGSLGGDPTPAVFKHGLANRGCVWQDIDIVLDKNQVEIIMLLKNKQKN
jgi:hypothetical protein